MWTTAGKNMVLVYHISQLLRFVLQDVARLAVKGFADCIQSGEPHCTYLAGLYLGEIDVGYSNLLRQFVERDLSVSHHPIKSKDYCHKRLSSKGLVHLLLQFDAIFKDER